MKNLLTLSIAVIMLSSCFTVKTPKENIIVERYFNNIKNNEHLLKDFFNKMPKGGDIHHHSSGTPYAEQYIENALRDSCYINPTTYQLYFNKKDAFLKKDSTAVLINKLLADNNNTRDAIIDNWSVRNYKEKNSNGHDLFFSTFTKFNPAFIGHEAELLSDICKKAAKDNILYIETMITAANVEDSIMVLANKNKWIAETDNLEAKFTELHTFFKKNNIKKWAKMNADSLDSFYNKTNKHGVKLKFQTYGVRVFPNKTNVFGQLLLGFETALLTNNLIGVNFVAPEDNLTALNDYNIHMKMFNFLNKKYPSVNISLHAGELAKGKGSVANKDLKFHIMEALKTGKAKRIGHGVDILFEDDFKSTLHFMRTNNIAVEINLESNNVILEIDKHTHPITKYLEHKVPVCISTDDEGVLRTNLTNQYILLTKYVPEITYKEVKEIVFNSIKYSFLDKNEKRNITKKLDSKFEIFEKNIIMLNK